MPTDLGAQFVWLSVGGSAAVGVPRAHSGSRAQSGIPLKAEGDEDSAGENTKKKRRSHFITNGNKWQVYLLRRVVSGFEPTTPGNREAAQPTG